MKKILALILMGMMCVYMTACATTKTTNKDQTDSDGSKKTAGQKDSNQNLSDMIKDATIDETVLVDENNIKITATELEYNTSSVDLKLKIENNTDKNLSFISNSLGYSCNSVNDYMISDGYLNCDVTSGKAANDSLSISYDSLLIYGINEFADIEIGFDIVDEDYDSTYTGPKKIMTSAAESYDYKEDSYRKTIKSDAAMNTYHYTA